MTPNERLLRVAHLLTHKVKYEDFIMDTWVCVSDDGNGETSHSEYVQERVDAGECGFAGCAVGHASQDPVLQAEGLPRADSECMGWDKVREFFSLTSSQAYHLFSLHAYGGHHPRPFAVACRIERFVDTTPNRT
jgi:hypothetical protein